MTIRDPHRQTPHFIRQLCLAILHRSCFDLGALWDCYCAAFVRSGRQQVGGGPGIALFRINPFSCLCLLLWIFLMFLLPWVRLCSLTSFSFSLQFLSCFLSFQISGVFPSSYIPYIHIFLLLSFFLARSMRAKPTWV